MAKATYFGVNNIARKVKKGYTGVPTSVPVYGEVEGGTFPITKSNISQYFVVTNGSPYYFEGNGGVFTTNNKTKNSTTATTVLTAMMNMDVSFDYSYSSEKSYDKFTLVIAGTTVESAVSGETTNKSWSGSLTAGQTISFTYAKDSSSQNYDDQCTFSNMVVTTESGEAQIGVTSKGIARKLKKGYIGVGGVARPFWGTGEVVYWGNKSQWNASSGKDRRAIGMATAGDYAILYCGALTDSATDNRKGYAYVEAYNSALTRTTASTVSNDQRYGSAGGTIGSRALFGGGDDVSTSNSTTRTNKGKLVSMYDASLTRSTASSSLTNKLVFPNCANIGEDYLVFGGTRGTDFNDKYIDNYTTTFDAYNSSFTRSQITSVYPTDVMVSVGDCMLCTGGAYMDQYDGVYSTNRTYTINKSLTVTTITNYVTAGGGIGATTLNNHAILAGGGEVSSGNSDTVHIWDTSLTHTIGTPLSKARRWAKGITLDGFAIFAGGTTRSLGVSWSSIGQSDHSEHALKTVDTYDESFTRVVAQDMSAVAYAHSAATNGKYALFSGGFGTKGQIEIYTVV